ncbi:MAG: nucleotidyl transferase AbiEii/AbiGii toxin family protein [Actinobacteria bacterium]|nr:nucleotidyl transferase AbiEii/AbiGii toxin family protein [Actinomycetota bacterium]
MSPPDGFRLPGDRADLERRITAWSRSIGLPEGWLRRYIATSVVLAMLGRARDAGGNELFIAKGGASMQLRFGTDARLTRDLDAAFRGKEPSIATALTAAFAEPLWEFTAKARELDPFDGDRLHALVYRHRIALAFRGRPFDTVSLELTEQPSARGEVLHPVLTLEDVRLPGPVPSTVLATPNPRASDLYDLLLLSRHVDDHGDWVAVAESCDAVFLERATHPWPCAVTVREGWAEQWTSLSRGLPLEALGVPADVAAAATQLNDQIHERLTR